MCTRSLARICAHSRTEHASWINPLTFAKQWSKACVGRARWVRALGQLTTPPVNLSAAMATSTHAAHPTTGSVAARCWWTRGRPCAAATTYLLMVWPFCSNIIIVVTGIRMIMGRRRRRKRRWRRRRKRSRNRKRRNRSGGSKRRRAGGRRRSRIRRRRRGKTRRRNELIFNGQWTRHTMLNYKFK